jgi:chemotaxis signal transduction protein
VTIEFVGSAENSAGNGADVTLTLPATQPGDLVIVAYAIGDNDSANQTMAMVTGGYTSVADLFSDDTLDVNLGVFWKVMGSPSETTAIVDGLGGTDAAVAAVAMVFRGVDTTTPMDVTATTDTGIDTGIANPPSINHNNPSGVWTVIAAGTAHSGGAAITYTFPTGYTTNAVDDGETDTTDVTVGMGYRTNPSDPEDPGSMTPSVADGVTFAWAAVTMALRPAAATTSASLIATEGSDTVSSSASVAAATEILRISWAQLEIPEAQEVTSTASLSATELGDTLVSAIALSVSSALSAIEDQDTISASASIGSAAEILRISWAQLELPEGAGISASLSATDGADTLNASASLNVVATLSASEDADVLSSSTSLAAGAEILRISWAQLEIPEGGSITASLSATEGRDTLSASATVEGNSSLSVDAFSITISFESAARAFAVTAAPFAITASFADADLEWSGGSRLVASLLEDVDVVAGSAAISISASTAVVEDGDYLSSSASVAGGGAITATAALDEEWDVVAASAVIALGAAAAVVEDPDTLVAETNATGSVNVSLSVQELDDVVSATATLALDVQATAAEDADVLAASAAVTIVASASVLEDADSLTGQVGTPQIAADVAVTESDDTVTASASLSLAASVSITEADDLSSASVSVFIVANASITEEDDDFAGGWGRQLFPAHIGLTNRGRGPRGSSGGGGPLGSSRSKGNITNTEWP